MHRQRVVKRARETGGGRKPARVRKQGVSCPQQKCLKVFKYVNRRVGRARCSTQASALAVSQDMLHFRESKGTHYNS